MIFYIEIHIKYSLIFAPEIGDKAFALAQKYSWQISEDKFLDPTDQSGSLGLEISFLFGILKLSTTLARLNEPPQGFDVSSYTRITAERVEVVTEKDIFADGMYVVFKYLRIYTQF